MSMKINLTQSTLNLKGGINMPRETEDYDDGNYIIAPLDVDNYAGDYEGQTSEWIKALGFGLGPLIFAPFLLQFLPIWLILIAEILWFIVVLAFTVGNHRERLRLYKKQLDSKYASLYELLRVKRVRDTGCIEYVNGRICYMIVGKFLAKGDEEERSRAFERFFSAIHQFNVDSDFYIENVVATDEMARRYKLVNRLKDINARNILVENLDYNIKLSTRKSKLYRPIYIIKGPRYKHKEILGAVKAAIGSNAARAFKEIRLITEEGEVNKIFSEDLKTDIDFQELTENKYADDHYQGCKVIGYDMQETAKKEVKQKSTISSDYSHEYNLRRFTRHE